MRLIDADKLKAHYAWWDNEEQRLFDQIVDVQPTVDAVPVVHAYYIPCKSGYGYKCSNCKAREKAGALISGTHKFCYACGARMDGRREDGADK